VGAFVNGCEGSQTGDSRETQSLTDCAQSEFALILLGSVTNRFHSCSLSHAYPYWLSGDISLDAPFDSSPISFMNETKAARPKSGRSLQLQLVQRRHGFVAASPSRSRRTFSVNRVLRDGEGMLRFKLTDHPPISSESMTLDCGHFVTGRRSSKSRLRS
jgi:hypothetical protein